MVDLQEFDEFKYPRRWPWLVLVLAIVTGVLLWQRRDRDPVAATDVPAAAPSAQGESLSAASVSNAAPVHTLGDMDMKVLSSEARAFEREGELLKARERYLELLARRPPPALRAEVEAKLGRLNTELVLTPRAMPEKVEYVVKSGDYVGRIARKFGTTVGLIQRSNKLANPNLIKQGDRLWILQGAFRILVSKKRNELTLFLNDDFFKRYAVSSGKYGKTPVGTFKITQKSTEPVWWRPDGKEVPYGDPENILGTRWMTLRSTGDTPDVRGYGIHGTWDESSIGKAESAGCIRMRNADVEELYALVPPGTDVEIVE